MKITDQDGQRHEMALAVVQFRRWAQRGAADNEDNMGIYRNIFVGDSYYSKDTVVPISTISQRCAFLPMPKKKGVYRVIILPFSI